MHAHTKSTKCAKIQTLLAKNVVSSVYKFIGGTADCQELPSMNIIPKLEQMFEVAWRLMCLKINMNSALQWHYESKNRIEDNKL